MAFTYDVLIIGAGHNVLVVAAYLARAGLRVLVREGVMPTVELPTGVRLYYQDPNPQGGPPVLLLHGLGATADSWTFQFPALIQAGMRPIAPDMRGFGRSSYPGSWTMQEVVNDLTGLLDRLEVSSAHIVGISLGGAVTLAFGLMQPARTRSLTLVNTFARLRPRQARNYPYFLLRFLLVWLLKPEIQARMVARRIFPRPEQEDLRQALIMQVAHANPKAYRAAMWHLARFNVYPHLGKIRVPTLVVTGGRDTTVVPEVQQELVEGIPGARHEVFPESGHGVTAEEPEAFNRLLVSFIQEVERDAL